MDSDAQTLVAIDRDAAQFDIVRRYPRTAGGCPGDLTAGWSPLSNSRFVIVQCVARIPHRRQDARNLWSEVFDLRTRRRWRTPLCIGWLANDGTQRVPEITGQSAFDLVRARGATEAEVSALRVHRDGLYSDSLRQGPPANPGVFEVLTLLQPRYRLGIVTSSKRAHLELVHARTQLLPFFEVAVVAGDYARFKPAPDPYLAAAERLEVSPAQCVAIEDSERGMRAAVAAGMACFVLPTRLTANGDFTAATRILEDVHQIEPSIASLAQLAGRLSE